MPNTKSNEVYLKDGNIVIDRARETSSVSHYQEEKTQNNSHKYWRIEEKVNPVDEALKVYRRKRFGRYKKRVWIVNKENGEHEITLEFFTDDGQKRVVFSPDEEYAYYLGLSPQGISIVYGVDLYRKNIFPVAEAYDYRILDCPDKKSYIAVYEKKKSDVIVIYTLSGEKKDSIKHTGLLEDAEKIFCP